MSEIHARIVDAVAAGGGVERVAELAAAALGGTVAIVSPAHAVAVAAPRGPDADLGELERYVDQRISRLPVPVPREVADERLVFAAGGAVGAVLHLGERAAAAAPVLEAAALATTVALALGPGSARERPLAEVLLRDLAQGRPAGGLVAERAHRAGIDLAGGAIALALRCDPQRPAPPARVRAAVGEQLAAAPVAALTPTEVVSLLPSADLPTARSVAGRLSHLGAVAIAPREEDPAQLGRALREARIAAILVARGVRPIADAPVGGHRLLVRIGADSAAAVSAVADETVRPLTDPAATRGVDLMGTLRTYLESGGRINATAAQMPSHRHTVVHRIARIRDLTGLDATDTIGRERLVLGLQALAVEAAIAELPPPGLYQI